MSDIIYELKEKLTINAASLKTLELAKGLYLKTINDVADNVTNIKIGAPIKNWYTKRWEQRILADVTLINKDPEKDYRKIFSEDLYKFAPKTKKSRKMFIVGG